jgi:hypothetical protein
MKLLPPLLKILNQLKVYHWQTASYAQHKAFGKAYDSLNGLIDVFIEVYTGKYGNVKSKITYKFELESYDESYLSFIDSCVNFFKNLQDELDSTDTDLLNIKDEMLAEINRLKYLLTLK